MASPTSSSSTSRPPGPSPDTGRHRRNSQESEESDLSDGGTLFHSHSDSSDEDYKPPSIDQDAFPLEYRKRLGESLARLDQRFVLAVKKVQEKWARKQRRIQREFQEEYSTVAEKKDALKKTKAELVAKSVRETLMFPRMIGNDLSATATLIASSSSTMASMAEVDAEIIAVTAAMDETQRTYGARKDRAYDSFQHELHRQNRRWEESRAKITKNREVFPGQSQTPNPPIAAPPEPPPQPPSQPPPMTNRQRSNIPVKLIQMPQLTPAKPRSKFTTPSNTPATGPTRKPSSVYATYIPNDPTDLSPLSSLSYSTPSSSYTINTSSSSRHSPFSTPSSFGTYISMSDDRTDISTPESSFHSIRHPSALSRSIATPSSRTLLSTPSLSDAPTSYRHSMISVGSRALRDFDEYEKNPIIVASSSKTSRYMWEDAEREFENIISDILEDCGGEQWVEQIVDRGRSEMKEAVGWAKRGGLVGDSGYTMERLVAWMWNMIDLGNVERDAGETNDERRIKWITKKTERWKKWKEGGETKGSDDGETAIPPPLRAKIEGEPRNSPSDAPSPQSESRESTLKRRKQGLPEWMCEKLREDAIAVLNPVVDPLWTVSEDSTLGIRWGTDDKGKNVGSRPPSKTSVSASATPTPPQSPPLQNAAVRS
ncbi:hypothetical protein BJ742DRAFT_70059 [Cladochytrium replicatum]|nr:hypothetical protein BJ742DRAFT_70059 [Cladochytrium replicatum]